MNVANKLSNRDTSLICQIAHFKAHIERRTNAYQKLLLLSMDMAQILAQQERHHGLVKQWATVAGELIRPN